MSKVKIETLTPVHIRSGNTLHKGMDYVVVNNNLYVIDPKKVLDIIGADKIDAWVSSIEHKEDVAGFIARQGINVSPAEYATRNMWCGKKGYKEYKTLKECIHDGRGLPYIPGSSIKGAIRTAVLATEIEGKEDYFVSKIRNSKETACNDVENLLFSNKDLPKKMPNTSCFRFLQIGDAYFSEGCEIVYNAINLNERGGTKELIDKGKSQAIEVIGYENETVFEIKLNETVYAQDKSGLIHKLPDAMSTLSVLFKTINAHTQKLLEYELEYWKKKKNEGFNGAESYTKYINSLIAETEDALSGKECILRVGHASGWRFTTGAWTEKFANFDEAIVPMTRHPKYSEFDFPKSRRVYEVENDEDDVLDNKTEVDVLGFVKLTLI